jgi:secreted trypsin-like serine protease
MGGKSTAILVTTLPILLLLGCGGSNSAEQILTAETVCSKAVLPNPTTKIVGGRECGSSNGTVVKILLFDEEENQTICSGVRLNVTSVLTAAHCINESVFSVLVELASGERIVPTKITRHPDATDLGSLFINDVAILTIEPPAGGTTPPTVQIAQSVAEGDILTILGYGVTNGVTQVGSGVLRIGEMRVNEVTTDSIFSDYTPPAMSNTCFGDSGGPAFVEAEDGGLALAGITSTGTNITCAIGDRSAFTNLTNQAILAFIRAGS